VTDIEQALADGAHERLLREAGQRRGCINTEPAYIGCDTHNSQWMPDFGCCYETVLLTIDSLARDAAVGRAVQDVDKLAKALDPVMNCDGTLDDAIALFLAAYEEARK